MSFEVNENVFKKNDIRGVVGEGISKELFNCVGKAFSTYIKEETSLDPKKEPVWVSVCHDARLHSPELFEALVSGLLSRGINVLDIGMSPTPFGYFSEFLAEKKEDLPKLTAALVVTASHNPSEYNGVKMTLQKGSLSENEINRLKALVKLEAVKFETLSVEKKAERKKYNLTADYVNHLMEIFPNNVGKRIKVVVDSGNATAGIVAPNLYRKLGCEVIDIFTEPDGRFPNHHPDPSKEENLKLLKEKIAEVGADFGIAFDGDTDRVGIVDNTGYSLPGDQLLLLLALDILKNNECSTDKKPAFISEVKCSQVLYDEINRCGGNAIMWKTGHAYIKSKMKEEKAVLSGEMSGHIFFKDRYFGYDDAVYAGARFIELMANRRKENASIQVSQLVEEIPQVCTSRELRIPCPDAYKFEIIDQMKEEFSQNPAMFKAEVKELITIDGMRVIFSNGFALIRASNTEPTFTLRFEGKTQEDLELYKNSMLEILNKKLEKVKTACK